MESTSIAEIDQLIARLRAIAPKRPLSYGESLQVGRRQAERLRRSLSVAQPDINLMWLIDQQAVPVKFVASHKLGEESGLTTDQITGRLTMFVNESEPRVRQRFSLLHEFKHVLDWRDADQLHARLGSGNASHQAQQIELIANDFAAHVLMPTALVKRWWFKTQHRALLATTFNVSLEAMTTRLTHLGLIGEPAKRPTTYFRRAGSLPGVDERATAVLFLHARPLGTDRQHDPLASAAIARQRSQVQMTAARLGAEVVREYVEYGGGGGIGHRAELRLMLEELRMLRDVDYLITSDPAALGRSRADQTAVAFELEAAGVQLVTAAESEAALDQAGVTA